MIDQSMPFIILSMFFPQETAIILGMEPRKRDMEYTVQGFLFKDTLPTVKQNSTHLVELLLSFTVTLPWELPRLQGFTHLK